MLIQNNICPKAFSSLAEAVYEAADVSEEGAEPDTYSLSSYFEPIVQKLLETTDRLEFIFGADLVEHP